MFMKKNVLGLAVAMGLVSTSSVFADESVDLAVVGVISPASCDIDLSAYAVDLGTISVKNLADTGVTTLAPQTVGVTVSCTGDVRFALSAVDNAAGSASVSDTDAFGMGKTATSQEIGYYKLRFNAGTLLGTVDGAGAAAVITLASNDRNNWTAAPADGVGPAIPHALDTYLGFADTGTTDVKALKDFSGTLQVEAFITDKADLTLTSDVDIDGAATLELHYL